MPPKIYRPPIPSSYIEPEELPDPLEGMECLHKPLGQSLWRAKQKPPPRRDIILFNPQNHQRELDKNTNWEGCSEFHRILITRILKEFWDVFAQEGLRNPIIGFQFVVDTGAAAPVCCRPPRYGFNEAPVIKNISRGLKENGIIEEDTGPWGAMIVLAAKPGQENVH